MYVDDQFQRRGPRVGLTLTVTVALAILLLALLIAQRVP